MTTSSRVACAALAGFSMVVLRSGSACAQDEGIRDKMASHYRVEGTSMGNWPADIDLCFKRSMCTSRSALYWGLHGAGLGLLAATALITNNAIDPKAPAKRVFAPTTQAAADAIAVLQVSLPLTAFALTTAGAEGADAMVSYAQAASAALTVNHVLRLAPLNSSATFSFATAITGAYLLDQRRLPYDAPPDYKRSLVDIRVRGVFWGLELSLATANSILAVRGGRTKWYAALVGAAAGTAIGVGTQWLHCWSNDPVCFVPSFARASGFDRDMIWVTNLSLLWFGAVLPFAAPPGIHDKNLEIGPTSLGPGSLGVGVRGEL